MPLAFCGCRPEALPRLHQFGGFFELRLRDGAFANHHFTQAVEAVAAGSEHQLAAVEEKLALHGAQHQLQLPGPPGRINLIQQHKQFVVCFHFAGIERQRSPRKPVRLVAGSRLFFQPDLPRLRRRGIAGPPIFYDFDGESLFPRFYSGYRKRWPAKLAGALCHKGFFASGRLTRNPRSQP